MQKLKSLFVAFIVMLVTVSYASSMEFKNIVMLGDSLSDNGNFFDVSEKVYPPAPYDQGRFSDGKVWFEYLAEEIGVSGMALNYAHGGATTGDTNVSDTPLHGDFPGFADEVEAYLAVAAASQKYKGAFAMPEDTLFVIWIGANDLWSVTPATATEQITKSMSNIQNGLANLIQAGASKFLVINLPDLGKSPKFNKNEATATAGTQIALVFNQALEQLLSGIESSYTNITIQRFDSFTLLSEIISNSSAFGFTNVVDRKLNVADGSVSEGIYLFWDDVHPTTFAHKIIAKEVAEIINCENCKVSTMPSVSNDFTITIPSAKFGDQTVEFILKPNATETGYFWTLDMESITVK
ncbi:MAG: SGNH/GDSL hydrolase family protein [Desulfamplus sp.]|nr:SGNH/GDSL hydrolase family protein [Desulfamplus sp.]